MPSIFIPSPATPRATGSSMHAAHVASPPASGLTLAAPTQHGALTLHRERPASSTPSSRRSRSTRPMPPSPRGLLDGVVLGPADVVTTARVAGAALSMLPPAARTDVRYRPEIPHMWTRRQLHLLGLMLTPAGSDFHARLLKRMKQREHAITGALVRLHADELVAKGAPLLDLPTDMLLEIVDRVQEADAIEMHGLRTRPTGVAAFTQTCRALRVALREVAFRARCEQDRFEPAKYWQWLHDLNAASVADSGLARTHDGDAHPSDERASGLIALIDDLGGWLRYSLQPWRNVGASLVRAIASPGPFMPPPPASPIVELARAIEACLPSLPGPQRSPVAERFAEEIVSRLHEPFAEIDVLERTLDAELGDGVKTRVLQRALQGAADSLTLRGRPRLAADLISALAAGRVDMPTDAPGAVVARLIEAVPERRPVENDDPVRRPMHTDMSVSPHAWDIVVIDLERIATRHAAALSSDLATRIGHLVRQRDQD